jgi:hypothetical protein
MWTAVFSLLGDSATAQGEQQAYESSLQAQQNAGFFNSLNIGGGNNSSNIITMIIIFAILGLVVFVAVKSV